MKTTLKIDRKIIKYSRIAFLSIIPVLILFILALQINQNSFIWPILNIDSLDPFHDRNLENTFSLTLLKPESYINKPEHLKASFFDDHAGFLQITSLKYQNTSNIVTSADMEIFSSSVVDPRLFSQRRILVSAKNIKLRNNMNINQIIFQSDRNDTEGSDLLFESYSNNYSPFKSQIPCAITQIEISASNPEEDSLFNLKFISSNYEKKYCDFVLSYAVKLENFPSIKLVHNTLLLLSTILSIPIANLMYQTLTKSRSNLLIYSICFQPNIILRNFFNMIVYGFFSHIEYLRSNIRIPYYLFQYAFQFLNGFLLLPIFCMSFGCLLHQLVNKIMIRSFWNKNFEGSKQDKNRLQMFTGSHNISLIRIVQKLLIILEIVIVVVHTLAANYFTFVLFSLSLVPFLLNVAVYGLNKSDSKYRVVYLHFCLLIVTMVMTSPRGILRKGAFIDYFDLKVYLLMIILFLVQVGIYQLMIMGLFPFLGGSIVNFDRYGVVVDIKKLKKSRKLFCSFCESELKEIQIKQMKRKRRKGVEQKDPKFAFLTQKIESDYFKKMEEIPNVLIAMTEEKSLFFKARDASRFSLNNKNEGKHKLMWLNQSKQMFKGMQNIEQKYKNKIVQTKKCGHLFHVSCFMLRLEIDNQCHFCDIDFERD